MRRGWEDTLLMGMSLAVGRTSVPIPGANQTNVLSDLYLFYIDFTLILHNLCKIYVKSM